MAKEFPVEGAVSFEFIEDFESYADDSRPFPLKRPVKPMARKLGDGVD